MRLICFLPLFCLAIATACNRSGKKVIGVVSKGQAHEYWQSVHAGAIAAANEFHVAILWNGPASEADINRQRQILDSMIAQHLDGIAVAPVERQALVPYVDRAKAARIPIVIYDSGIDTSGYVSFIATNNSKAGELAARKLEYDRTINVPNGKKMIEHTIQQLVVELQADSIRILDRSNSDQGEAAEKPSDDEAPY